VNTFRHFLQALKNRSTHHAADDSVDAVAPTSQVIETAWQLGGQLPPLASEHLPAAVWFPGDQRAVRLGQGMDFESLRAYQPGEPSHLIDWRISARTPEPVVRIFREPAQRQCHIVLDTSDSMFFGTRRQLKITQALTVAHLLTAAALHQNLSVALHTPGLANRVPRHPATSRAALLNQLQEIGQWLAPPATPQPIDWTGFRGRLQSCLPEGQIVIVLSDFQTDFTNDPSLMCWLPLAKKQHLMLLSMIDPAERLLPDMGTVTFVAQPPQRLDTHDAAVRAELSERFTRRQSAVRAFCQGVGGLFDEIQTVTDLPALMDDFSELLLTGHSRESSEQPQHHPLNNPPNRSMGASL
jgi:uncharacterized protein (DUF58 family)